MRAKSAERQQAERIEKNLGAAFDRMALQYNQRRSEWDHEAVAQIWEEVQSLRRDLERISRNWKNCQGRGTLDRSRGAQKERQYFQGVRGRLRKWRKMQCAFDDLENARPTPLYEFAVSSDSMLSQQLNAVDSALHLFHRISNPLEQDGAAAELGCHPDIPMRASTFIAHCHAAYRIALAQRRNDPPRFLDVGCGISLTLLMAARFFESVTGLEFDPGYVRAAQDVISRSGLNDARILEGDALEFADYGAFDVIYFYQPLRSVKKLVELEKKIIRDARKGTILIAPYQEFHRRHDGQGCAGFGHFIFVAGLDEKEADELKSEAEMIGTAIYDASRNDIRNAGFLEGFLDLCRRNGIEFRQRSAPGSIRGLTGPGDIA